MSEYQIRIHPAALASMQEAQDWIAGRSVEAAERWTDGLQEAILSLQQFPTRCGLARESRSLSFELRQMIYGKRAGRYRILFAVRGNVVHVLDVRHGARDVIGPGELRLPEE
jgi:plasmid stabilization system protein ParE